MLELMRCKTCGKLRRWSNATADQSMIFCGRCGSGVVCGPGYYGLVERIKIVWWCLRDNWRAGAVTGPIRFAQCMYLGLTPELPKA